MTKERRLTAADNVMKEIRAHRAHPCAQAHRKVFLTDTARLDLIGYY